MNKNTNSKSIILSIKMSKNNEKGPLAAEQMFANLHGILRKASKQAECLPHQEYYSFEIANIHNNIYFIAWLPDYLRDFFQAQLYAQYPDVEIQEIQDYIDFKKYQSIAVAELDLLKHDIFPINTFEAFEDQMAKHALDPLSSITEAIRTGVSHVDEHVALQILFKPIHTKKLQSKVFSSMKRLQRGKKIFFLGNEKLLFQETSKLKQIFYAPFEVFRRNRTQSSLDALHEQELKKDESTTDLNDIGKMTSNAIMAKSSRLGFRVIIRAAFWSDKLLPKEQLEFKIQAIANSFKQFNSAYLNGFDVKTFFDINSFALFKTRRFGSQEGMFLNTTELATIFHLPNMLVETPNIVWVTSRKTQAPVNLPTFDNTPEEQLTILGKTTFRNSHKTFGIKPDDRRRHVYIIGKTGMGKSVLMQNMIFSDMVNGRGVAVVDPHGELAEDVLRLVPEYRKNDVIVIDPSDSEFPVAINMLEGVDSAEGRSLISSALVGVFKKMFGDSWGPRLEYVLRNTILALIEAPETSMMGIMRMLVDESYRKKILEHVTDPVVLSYWNTEFANYNPRNIAEIISPIQNKVGQFLSSPIIRNIVGQTKNTIDIRNAMDTSKIVIVNLSKGKIGEDNSALLGSMLVTRFQLDAMSRSDIDEKKRVDFYLYVDEFQNFATDSFATILSEARKYKLNLTVANQYIAQMSEVVAGAVFGNVGTMITFQLGNDDAEIFEKQYSQVLSANDIMSLDKYTIYTRLLIDGMPAPAFSAATLPPPDIRVEDHYVEMLKNISREKYSMHRENVEAKIHEWTSAQKSNVASKKAKQEAQVDISNIHVGQTVKANVIGITDYGLFLSYQGVEGLLHMNKMPDDRRDQLLTTSKKGDLLEVIVLDKLEKQGKLAYSLISLDEAQKINHIITQQQSKL